MQEQNVEFKDAAGIPANAHAKKLAKEKEKIQKLKSQLVKVFFTIRNGKVLQITAKPNGAHSSYLASERKYKKSIGADAFNAQIAKWKKEGSWVEPHDHTVLNEAVAELAEKFEAGLKAKKK